MSIKPSTYDGDKLASFGSFKKRRVPMNMLKMPLPTPVSMKKKLRPMHGILMLLAMMIKPKKHM